MKRRNYNTVLTLCTVFVASLNIANNIQPSKAMDTYSKADKNIVLQDIDTTQDKNSSDIKNDSSSELDEDVKELIANVSSVEDLMAANYIKYQIIPDKEEIHLGDVMVSTDGNIYVATTNEASVLDSNSEVIWWHIEKDNITLTTEDIYSLNNTFFYHQKEEPLAINIKPITASYGMYLNDIELPNGFSWIDNNELLGTIEDKIYHVSYTPQNTLKYYPIELEVVVKTHKLQSVTSTIPEESYTVNYYPNSTLNSIKLPIGWQWENPDILLDVGIYKYKALYKNGNGLKNDDITEMEIEVIVEKSSFAIKGLTITMNEDSKLIDDLLPTFIEGRLEWEEKDKQITTNTTEYCKFIPYDEVHYNRTDRIPVIINVVPKTEIISDDTTPDDDVPDETLDTTPDDDVPDETTDTTPDEDVPNEITDTTPDDEDTPSNTPTDDKPDNKPNDNKKPDDDIDIPLNPMDSDDKPNLPTIDLSLNTQDDTYDELPFINIPTMGNETKLPTISLMGNADEPTLPTIDITKEDVADQNVQADEVVGNILENQEKNASTEEKLTEDEKTKTKKTSVDPFGIMAILGGLGIGGYALLSKIKGKNLKR